MGIPFRSAAGYRFEANAGGSVHTIDKGGTGWDADAMVNIPVIPDRFAIRLVDFGARHAGHIDNVLANTPGRIDPETGEQIVGSQTNAFIVEDDFNDAEWVGGRIPGKWQINDRWSLINLDVNGFNDFDPTADDLKTTKFKRESRDDEWGGKRTTRPHRTNRRPMQLQRDQ